MQDMAESSLNSDFNELKKKVRRYFKYKRMDDLLYFLFFLVFTASVVYLVILNEQASLESLAYPALVIILVLFLLSISWRLVSRKKDEMSLEDDEWLRFYSLSVWDSLKKYSEEKTNTILKRVYRKKALKYAGYLLSSIERWDIGKFKPVQSLLGNTVSDFKDNIKNRVIPAIRDGDDHLLSIVELVMRIINNLSKKLTIDNIERMNKLMSLKKGSEESRTGDVGYLPYRKPLSIGKTEKLLLLLKTHNASRHILIALSLLVFCSIAGYIGIYILGIDKNYVWTGLIAAFVGLFGIYFSRQPKTRE
jgi:hypothetical protein